MKNDKNNKKTPKEQIKELILCKKKNRMFDAALDIMRQLSEEIKMADVQVDAYIAGGMAVSWWIGEDRWSIDVDAFFSHRLMMPELKSNLEIDNEEHEVFLDHNFNDTFMLIQQDYPDRATEVAVFNNLHIHVIAPVDLIITKIARLSNQDLMDIDLLIGKNLVDRDEFHELLSDALIDFIGNPDRILHKLKIIERLFNVNEKKKEKENESTAETDWPRS